MHWTSQYKNPPSQTCWKLFNLDFPPAPDTGTPLTPGQPCLPLDMFKHVHYEALQTLFDSLKSPLLQVEEKTPVDFCVQIASVKTPQQKMSVYTKGQWLTSSVSVNASNLINWGWKPFFGKTHSNLLRNLSNLIKAI